MVIIAMYGNGGYFNMIEPGIKGTASLVVDESTSAKTVGSGNVNLLSSAIMIAFMEKAAWTGVSPFLPAGHGTVGIMVNVKHVRPTPLGMSVTCEAELTEVKGKRLLFRVTASDEKGLIGEGIHERVIVDEVPFQEKANAK
jgi:predicted thioesterase